MTRYEASNGVIIHRLERGIGFENAAEQVIDKENAAGLSPWGINDRKVDALREFFRAEEDERLGRWRWPENPDYVVYPRTEDVLVLFEMNGEGGVLYRRGDPVHDFEGQAARAYFDAHPQPQPWHDAKPGETWRLTVTDRQPEDLDLTFNVIGVEGVVGARFARPQVSGEQMEYRIDSPAIVAGRRIWPEDAS